MKKILVVLIGAILLAVIVIFIESQCLSMEKKEYKQQLEDIINNKHLEGKDAIGAFYYPEYKDSVSVSDISFFKFDDLSWLSVDYTTIWEGNPYFDNKEIITQMLRSDNYKWYNFSYPISSSSPFLIIVKKTDRGYDIIGEFILGIGLTDLYPDYLITKQEDPLFNPRLSKKRGYIYKIKTDMIDSYVEHLFDQKYSGITIRNERSQDNRSPKFDMLDNLVKKGFCLKDSSLYYRVNKYFELKYDDYFETIGSSPVVWETRAFGNHTQAVFAGTMTTHYCIQENEGLLDTEYKKQTIILLIALEFLYLLLAVSFLLCKKKISFIQFIEKTK